MRWNAGPATGPWSIRAVAGLAAALVLFAACAPARTASSGALNGRFLMSTGGGALAQVQALTKRFSELYPGVRWEIENVGSDAGVGLVVLGHSDLGAISRDLLPSEKGTVALEPLGVVGTASAVSVDFPVNALTREQLRRVFAGEVTDWSAVGGPALPIRVFIREPSASTRQHFDEFVFGGATPAYAKTAVTVGNNAEMATTIKSFAGSIGMVTLKQSTVDDKRLRLITIDGVPATMAALNDGTYRFRRPLSLVYPTDPAKMKPAVAAFIEFVRSAEGQRILAGF